MFVFLLGRLIFLFRLPDHGQEDLQLLGLEDEGLLGVLVDQGRLHVLGLFAKVRGKLQALDVAPVMIRPQGYRLLGQYG